MIIIHHNKLFHSNVEDKKIHSDSNYIYLLVFTIK